MKKKNLNEFEILTVLSGVLHKFPASQRAEIVRAHACHAQLLAKVRDYKEYVSVAFPESALVSQLGNIITYAEGK